MAKCPFCNGDTQYDDRMYRGETVTVEFCPFCDRTMNPGAVPGSTLKSVDEQVEEKLRKRQSETLSKRPFKKE